MDASLASSATSIPAQNEGPSPDTTTRRTLSSEAARRAHSASSSNICAFIALRLSGRASAMRAMPSAASYLMVASMPRTYTIDR